MSSPPAAGERAEAAVGCLLGGAVGDALGLPREGLPPERARRLFGSTVRHCFLGRRGMVSDDTEHALLTALALAEQPSDADAFARVLARRLRQWVLLLPAGVGLATLRACVRLLAGVPPDRSGVLSAGNGPLMRAAIIGVCQAGDVAAMRAYVRASSRLTHTDPKAQRAALLVALAAGWSLRHPGRPPSGEAVQAEAAALLPGADDELRAVLRRAADPRPLTDEWPRGPGGYAYHTLLAVLHTWLHAGTDFRGASEVLIALGGDTDTGAAVLGGLLGANLGTAAVPAEWLAGLGEWPRGEAWMRQAAAAAVGQSPRPPWQAGRTLVRNLLFLVVVLGHGFYRLLRVGRV